MTLNYFLWSAILPLKILNLKLVLLWGYHYYNLKGNLVQSHGIIGFLGLEKTSMNTHSNHEPSSITFTTIPHP